MDTSAITAATPMMIPSIVNNDRILLAIRDDQAIKKPSLYMAFTSYLQSFHMRIDSIFYNKTIF